VNTDAAAAVNPDTFSAGVSWSAVIGGALVMSAAWLLMLALGAGFELSTISPWARAGASAAAVGTTALVWLIVAHAVASSLGGYLTGRLRTRWQTIHKDEVHFRDTANGFLAWAVSVVVAAALLTAAASVLAGSGSTSSGTEAAERGEASLVSAYWVDQLFRNDRGAPVDEVTRAEASRILEHDLLTKGDTQSDTAYLTQMVAAKTGLNAADASSQVSRAITQARQTADDARKAGARILLWTFLALLIGAFCASFSATAGGRQRDKVEAI
jgi:hypothetical protein